MTRQRFLVVYTCLVGLPVFGVLGALRLGRDLVAPVAVSGSWILETEAPVPGGACADAVSRHRVLTVSQSGRYVTVRVADPQTPAVAGTIEGNVLSVGDASGSVARDCRDASGIYLHATVRGEGAQPRLTGTLHAAGCECPAISFHSVPAR